MARKKYRIICLLSASPPCVIPMKSSRYTSTWDRDVARACGDRSSQSFLASAVAATSCAEVFGGFVSATPSMWCGGTVCCMDRVSSARSLTVSVVDQKKAADSTYPMGIER